MAVNNRLEDSGNGAGEKKMLSIKEIGILCDYLGGRKNPEIKERMEPINQPVDYDTEIQIVTFLREQLGIISKDMGICQDCGLPFPFEGSYQTKYDPVATYLEFCDDCYKLAFSDTFGNRQ